MARDPPCRPGAARSAMRISTIYGPMSAAAADRQRCRLIAADLTFSCNDCRKLVWELQIESGTRDIGLRGRVLTSHVRFRANRTLSRYRRSTESDPQRTFEATTGNVSIQNNSGLAQGPSPCS